MFCIIADIDFVKTDKISGKTADKLCFWEGAEACMENVKIIAMSGFPNVSDLRIFQKYSNKFLFNNEMW